MVVVDGAVAAAVQAAMAVVASNDLPVVVEPLDVTAVVALAAAVVANGSVKASKVVM